MIRTSLTLGMALAASAVLLLPADVQAQRGGRGGPAPTPRATAPSDFSGYWVSVITEDWKLRMVTPNKGVYDTLTLNAEGRRVAETFDPARDEAAGEQCKAYGVNAGRRGSVRVGTLKVITSNLRPGYLRKNGAPYSDKTKVTEYFDLNTAPNGDRWLTVTTKVEDPVYFTRPLLTSSDFKHLATADGWSPSPCSAR